MRSFSGHHFFLLPSELTRQEFKRKAADDDSFRDELFDLYVMAKEPRNSDDATDYISDVSEGSSTKGGKKVDVGKTLSQSLNTKSNNVNTNDDANAKRADSHKPRTGSNRLATLPKDAEDNDSLTYSKNSKSKDKTVSSDKVTYVDRRDSDQLDATGASASLHSSKIAGDLSKTNDSDGVGASASSDFKKSARVNQNNNGEYRIVAYSIPISGKCLCAVLILFYNHFHSQLPRIFKTLRILKAVAQTPPSNQAY